MIELACLEKIVAQAQAAYNALKNARASAEFAQLLAKGEELMDQAKEMADDVSEIALLTLQVYELYVKPPSARSILNPPESLDTVQTRGDLLEYIVHQVRRLDA